MPHRIPTAAIASTTGTTTVLARRALFVLLASAPLAPAVAAPLYLCKSYANAGQFWSANHCSKTNALVEKVVTVPDNLAFDQQVHAAERALAQSPAAAPSGTAATPAARGATAGALPPPLTAASASALAAQKAPMVECKALEAQLRQINVELRSVAAPDNQKPLLDRKHKALERRFALRCPN